MKPEEAAASTCPLGRASSLLFNSQTPITPRRDADHHSKPAQQVLTKIEHSIVLRDEIIADSEEERVQERARLATRRLQSFSDEEVIELFSSDEEERTAPPHTSPSNNAGTTPKAISRPRPNPVTAVAPTQTKPSSTAKRSKKAKPPRTPRARRIIYSSSSGSSSDSSTRLGSKPILKLPHTLAVTSCKPVIPNEVIEISDSSDSETDDKVVTGLVQSQNPDISLPERTASARDDLGATSSHGEYWSDVDDGSILVFNEPKSARTPIRRKPYPPTGSARNDLGGSSSNTASRPFFVQHDSGSTSSIPLLELSDDSGGFTLVADPTPLSTPAITRLRFSEDSPATPTSSSSTLPSASKENSGARKNTARTKAPRVTKKAAAEAEHARLDEYAHELFTELNRTVFEGGIPRETRLVWSSRLLTTAGRAKWHRSKQGVDTVEIELAQKVLDCDERIRNTLSHEMCHLACWLISNKPTEHHGEVFKTWGRRVMKKRPDIEVSTRHDYDIRYQYEWKCAECSKIYGRHSKSINPDTVLCGACEKGKLIPQFTTRGPKTPKKTASRNAGAARDSPRTVPSPSAVITLDDSDDDVDELTKGIESLGVGLVI